MRYIHHINRWSFGTTDYIIAPDGRSIVRISYYDDFPDAAFINGLSVFHEERGKGRARDIMREAEESIREKGIKIVFIDSEEEWIAKWYMRLGFELYDEKDGIFKLKKNYEQNQGIIRSDEEII